MKFDISQSGTLTQKGYHRSRFNLHRLSQFLKFQGLNVKIEVLKDEFRQKWSRRVAVKSADMHVIESEKRISIGRKMNSAPGSLQSHMSRWRHYGTRVLFFSCSVY